MMISLYMDLLLMELERTVDSSFFNGIDTTMEQKKIEANLIREITACQK